MEFAKQHMKTPGTLVVNCWMCNEICNKSQQVWHWVNGFLKTCSHQTLFRRQKCPVSNKSMYRRNRKSCDITSASGTVHWSSGSAVWISQYYLDGVACPEFKIWTLTEKMCRINRSVWKPTWERIWSHTPRAFYLFFLFCIQTMIKIPSILLLCNFFPSSDCCKTANHQTGS